MTNTPDSSPNSTVKSAERALALLELLTKRERPMGFGQIANSLGYPKSSLHQLLRTLIDRGWVEVESETGHYTLGIRTWEAGNAYLRALDLIARAKPYMEAVRDELDETVQLAVLDGRYNVYIAKVDGTQNLAMVSAVGRRIEAHATGLGKALLSGLSDAQVVALFRGIEPEKFTTTTVSDLGELIVELDRVRASGYAIDNEEHTHGVRCVAAPLRDQNGTVIAALSVSVPTVRWTQENEKHTVILLVDASKRLSQALGWRPAA
jgi:DNA-binding IclR family transcriptional regulator